MVFPCLAFKSPNFLNYFEILQKIYKICLFILKSLEFFEGFLKILVINLNFAFKFDVLDFFV